MRREADSDLFLETGPVDGEEGGEREDRQGAKERKRQVARDRSLTRRLLRSVEARLISVSGNTSALRNIIRNKGRDEPAHIR